MAVAEVTIKWIRELRKEGSVSRIIKTIYNEVHDITDLVIELDNQY